MTNRTKRLLYFGTCFLCIGLSLVSLIAVAFGADATATALAIAALGVCALLVYFSSLIM